MVKPSGIKRGSSKGVAGQVSTSPKEKNVHKTTAAKRMSGVVKKVKVSRKGLPNIQGAESFPKMTAGGMNDEANLRKVRRQNQGL